MHILFLTHNFAPESNAPAVRTYENAKRWVKRGHMVTVVTCVPNHPDGIVYPGYRNRLFEWDRLGDIRVLRIKTLLSANAGVLRRTMSHVSFLISAVLLCCLVRDVDLVVSTSPQFFCGMSGYFVSRLKRCRWVLEVRDLWPASIEALGVVRRKSLLGLLANLEGFVYRRADHTIALTRSFKRHIVERGAGEEKVSVVTNGADLERFRVLSPKDCPRSALGLSGKFVISYIGTIGMAHGLETVLRAAQLLKSKEQIRFLIMGNGAERKRLLEKKEALLLENVIILPARPTEEVPGFIAASDACMVLLRKKQIFTTVIPSKIFEAMAMARPVVLGVDGEAREIVERARCGICIDPEDHGRLAEAVLCLYGDPGLCARLGQNARNYVEEHFDREKLAGGYLGILEKVWKSKNGFAPQTVRWQEKADFYG